MTYTIGQYAIGQWGIDLSTPDYFQELLKRPDFELIYLIEMYPYNSSIVNSVMGSGPVGVNPVGAWDFEYSGGIQSIYFSDRGYITDESDTPAHTNYLPRTNNPFQFDVSVFNGEFTGKTGSFGAIRILNGDGDFDDLTDLYWSGRSVKVFAGSADFTREQFVKVFDGVCASIEHSEDELIINIQNSEKTLESEFVQNKYGGYGGIDGGSDLAEKPKPLLYGECLHITPVLVDATNLIYQVHDGSMEAVTAVYDRGVALTSSGDVADITTATVSAGHFKTQLSGGYIKLGSTPDGQITVDAKGDNTGGYVSTSGKIATRLLRTKLGLFNLIDSDIDQGAFNLIDLTVPAAIGIYITEKTSVLNVFNSIFTPIQCYWTYDEQGLITAGIGKEPETDSVFELNENNIIDGTFQVTNVYPPSWRVNIGYARNWTSQSEIATGASDTYRDFVQEDFRRIIIEDRNIRTLSSNAIERTYDTLLANESDATALASRITELYNSQRKIYKMSVKDLVFRVYVGDTVSIKLNRFNLDAGKNFLVIGLGVDAETNITELEVWG